MDSSSTHDNAFIVPAPRYEFEHHRLDAWKVALEAQVLGDQIARCLGADTARSRTS